MQDDTLFDSQNAAYAQAMFEEYARNPDAVPSEWHKLFENGASLAISEGLLVPDQLVDSRPVTPPSAHVSASGTAATTGPAAAAPVAAPVSPVPHNQADEDARALLELLPAVSRATAAASATLLST